MVLPKRLLLTLFAFGCLAAPASAADVTYDISAFTFLNGTASGTDGGGWDSSSAWETEIDQQIKGIPATDDQDSIVGTPTNYRIFVTKLKQDYSLETVLDTITWNCVNDGVAKSLPGSVTMTRNGDVYDVSLSVSNEITQARSCTGFSSFADTITITPGPAYTEFSVPIETLEKEGFYSHTIDKKLLCGEWTIFQTACDLRFGGSVSIVRRAAAPPEDPKPIKKVTAQPLPGDKGAAVKVTCSSACSGEVSATAVATKRLKEKQVGQKSFETKKAGTRKVEIIYGKKNSRAVRQRGSVIIDVRSGGKHIKSVRL
jgi:hypothetical protein